MSPERRQYPVQRAVGICQPPRLKVPMFPSLFRSPIQGRCSLLLMGVGLGEDSCLKVLDRSRLSPGRGEWSS